MVHCHVPYPRDLVVVPQAFFVKVRFQYRPWHRAVRMPHYLRHQSLSGHSLLQGDLGCRSSTGCHL